MDIIHDVTKWAVHLWFQVLFSDILERNKDYWGRAFTGMLQSPSIDVKKYSWGIKQGSLQLFELFSLSLDMSGLVGRR